VNSVWRGWSSVWRGRGRTFITAKIFLCSPNKRNINGQSFQTENNFEKWFTQPEADVCEGLYPEVGQL
jgi:hypothetical protein